MTGEDGVPPPTERRSSEPPEASRSRGPSEEPGGLWAQLWKRRVPYFLGAFVAAIAGSVQFVDYRTEDEIEHYLEILRFAPSQTQALPAADDVHLRSADYESVTRHMEQYSELSPKDMHTYPRLARAYGAVGRFDETREARARALAVWSAADPGYTPAEEARELLASLRSD